MSPWVIALIPLLPLIAAGTVAAAGRRWGGRSHWPAVAAVLCTFGLSVLVAVTVLRHGSWAVSLLAWKGARGPDIRVGLDVDRLAAVMLLLVTGVSSVVHLYSVRYMQGEPGYGRYFSLLGVITSAVAGVVLADDLLTLFLFWELVGMGLYLLLAHRRERPSARAAARKTLVIHAVADGAFLLGVLLAWRTFGTLEIHRLALRLPAVAGRAIHPLAWMGLPDVQVPAVAAVALLLYAGAAGRSAQLPFHMWLPDTMDTPTPVSALMHAGIVNSGGFLVARMSFLFRAAPHVSDLIFLLGAATALYGTTVMLAQPDVKRSLGYSTMGQMGYMMMEAGLGAYALSIFHLVAHGLFKATQFLGAGEVAAARDPRVDPHPSADGARGSSRAAPMLLLLASLAFGGLVAAALGLAPGQAELAVPAMFGWATAFWAVSGLVRQGRNLRFPGMALAGLAFAGLAAAYVAGVGAFDAFLSPAVAPPPGHVGGAAGNLGVAWMALAAGIPLAAALASAVPARVPSRLSASLHRVADAVYVFALSRGYEEELFPLRWRGAGVQGERSSAAVGAARLSAGAGRQGNPVT